MATLYSDLYKAKAEQGHVAGASKNYAGTLGAMTKGSTHTVLATVDLADGMTSGDVLKLAGVPQGAKLISIAISPSADLDSDNDFTFNLGWTSSANAHASASTGLQGSTAFEMDAGDLVSKDAAAVGDELIMTATAGELTEGTLTVVAVIAL